MKTIYVKITDDLLNDLSECYKNACPITETHAFSIYLAAEELKRWRDKKAQISKLLRNIPISGKLVELTRIEILQLLED